MPSTLESSTRGPPKVRVCEEELPLPTARPAAGLAREVPGAAGLRARGGGGGKEEEEEEEEGGGRREEG
eukprot:3483977-Alexandrium_andersonii.AAC.1